MSIRAPLAACLANGPTYEDESVLRWLVAQRG